MRYYDVQITNPDSGALLRHYTSFVNGRTDMGALNVELDIPVSSFATPYGNSYVRVWGIPLSEISQSVNLNGKNIRVSGGMRAGLPLANPAQAGLLVSGTVLQAFANWIGTEQTLDLYLGPASGKVSAPKNIVFDWRAGTPLMQAIQATITRAFPGFQVSGTVGPGIVSPHVV